MIASEMAEISFKESSQFIEWTVNGKVEFRDSISHWNNAVVRLLERDEVELRQFIESSCILLAATDLQGDAVIDALHESWRTISNVAQCSQIPQTPKWSQSLIEDGQWLTQSVRDSPEFGIAYSSHINHAWLANKSTGLPAGLDAVSYDEEYFEGQKAGVGYGSYSSQSDWRLEKAHRQCREVMGILMYLGYNHLDLKILDVGSGYGYFRKACTDRGWSTDGIEISDHACQNCQTMFGLDSFAGTLEEFCEQKKQHFDVIVMWDFLEHVEDPVTALVHAEQLLKNGGVLFIRTPNLNAVEFSVFGADYHSLKREHLSLFSAESLSNIMTTAGLLPALNLSESHLLSGFTRARVRRWAATLRGSDLLSIARKID